MKYIYIIVFLLFPFTAFSQDEGIKVVTSDKIDSIQIKFFNDSFESEKAVSRFSFILSSDNPKMISDTIIYSQEVIVKMIYCINNLSFKETSDNANDLILSLQCKHGKTFYAEKSSTDVGDNRMLMILYYGYSKQYIWFMMNGIQIGRNVYFYNHQIKSIVDKWIN